MAEKTCILILTPFYEPNVGGVETHLKDLVRYLDKKGKYRICVLTYQPITTKAKASYFEKDKNIVIIRIPWIGFNLFNKLEPYPILEFFYVTPWLFMWSFIYILFKGKEIDIIHAQGFNAAFITRLLRYFLKKKFIASTHTVYEMNPNSLVAKLVRWTLKGADKILALTEFSKKELVNIGLNAGKVDTYTYWVDQEVFKPIDNIDAKLKVGWQNKFIVLFVGRFIEAKGIETILDVAKTINKDIYFAFIGDGPLGKTIKRESEKYSNIMFIGKIENYKLPVYYSAADILCLPSRMEGLPRVILEALSCGTPVIASKIGAISEAIDNSLGMLVEQTADELHNAILYFFENPKELEIRRKGCRDSAVKKFGTSNAEKIINSYV